MNELKIDIITKQISLVKRVLQKCELIHTNTVTDTKIENIFAWYTGIYTSIFRNSTEKRKPITFTQLMHYKDHHPLIQNNISVSEFRRILKKIYLIDRNIPKLEDFNCSESEKTKNDGCSKQKTSFKLLTLPGTTKGIIVEDPVRVLRRTLFLKKMAEVRQENCHIIYVNTIKNFETKICKIKPTTIETSVTDNHLFVAVSMKLGVLEAGFYQDESQTIKCLLNLLSPITETCVVVMEEEHNDTPTLTSPKVEMSDWLTANDVPHDPKAHRGELYDLIKLTMIQGKTSRTDDVIRALGHHVLRYPDDVEELNLLRDNFLNIVSKINLHSDQCNKQIVLDYIKEVKLDVWQEFEKHVMIDSEWYMLQEDMMMEKIVDGLCMMATDGADSSLADHLIDLPDWNKIASKLVI